MNEKQEKLYDYLITHKLGAFNSIANSRWTNDMRRMNMEDEAKLAGKYIDDVAMEGMREMWRQGIDDIASLSRKEIREVAESVYLYALENKKWRMTCSAKRLDKIIMEEINKVLLGESNGQVLKKVKANGLDIWAELEGVTMWIKWNYENGKPHSQRSEWLRHEKGSLFSTMTDWDELDFALQSLGVKKVSSKSHIEDYGNNDTDVFTKSVYDFSSIL